MVNVRSCSFVLSCVSEEEITKSLHNPKMKISQDRCRMAAGNNAISLIRRVLCAPLDVIENSSHGNSKAANVYAHSSLPSCMLCSMCLIKKEEEKNTLVPVTACARASVCVCGCVYRLLLSSTSIDIQTNCIHIQTQNHNDTRSSSTDLVEKHFWSWIFRLKSEWSWLVYEIPRRCVCVRLRSRYRTYVCHHHKNQSESIFIWIYDWRFFVNIWT